MGVRHNAQKEHHALAKELMKELKILNSNESMWIVVNKKEASN